MTDADIDIIIESLAKFLLNVFSDTYDENFEKMLVSGGGGNSMFVQSWQKPSKLFVKIRISTEAKNKLLEHGYTLETMPHVFLCHNAKGAKNRIASGKHLHMDHNPGNVKVLHLIRDRIRSYRKAMTKEEKINDLKEYIRDVQTLDIITVEQDDIRTLRDANYTKKEKDMLTSAQKDALLNDTWTELGPEFKYIF